MWTFNRIDHVVLWVRDLEKSMEFYERLGFEINQASLEEHRAGNIPFVAGRVGPNNQIDLRPDAKWVPVERHRVKIDIRVASLGQVAAAPVKIPNWKLCQDLHLKHLPPQFSLIWM